jgi:hypothetical protein
MTCTFATNDLDTAMLVAAEQSRDGRWRGVFPGPDGLFQVHDVAPSVGTDLVPIVTAKNGRVQQP